MKVALSVWNGRIAPVFDVSRRILLLDIHHRVVTGREEETFEEDDPVRKAGKLAEWKVRKLLCGAISRPLAGLFAAYGIRTIPFLAGDAEEVIEAYLAGELPNRRLTMPGCCRGSGPRIRKNDSDKEGNPMFGKRRGGMGQGGGRGQGRGGQRPGRMGGPLAAGPSGYCVCPQCGQREPHERGVPCLVRKCPKCGSTMARE